MSLIQVTTIRTGRWDFRTKRATVLRLNFLWVDEDSVTPRSLVGYGARFVLKQRASSPSNLVSKDDSDGIVLGGDLGTVEIEVSDEEMTIDKKAYWYDITLVEPGGEDVAFLAGVARVTYDDYDIQSGMFVVRGVGVQGPSGSGGGGGSGDVVGPSSSTNNNLVQFNGTTGKLVKEISPTNARTLLNVNNVDNTSDANKPVSTATQTALDGKQPLSAILTAFVNLIPANNDFFQRKAGAWVNRTIAQVKTDLAYTKTDVGLANVDNTSDANKPVSMAAQIALDSKADLVGGFVPAEQLPSFVDDVLEFANFAALPATGASGKIYVTLNNNLTYRWSGSAYVEISASLALGETSGTAYRGDRGKTAYDHSQITNGNPHGVTKADVGLSNATNTSDANKPVSTAQQAAIDAVSSAISGHISDTTAAHAASAISAEAFDDIPAGTVQEQLEAVNAKAGSGGGGGGFDPFPSGWIVVNRDIVNENMACYSGTLSLAYFIARKSGTTTKSRVFTHYSTPSNNSLQRTGLWAIDGSGNGTLVASSTNDPFWLTTSYTAFEKNWTTPYDMVKDQLYAWGFLAYGGDAVGLYCAATQGEFKNELLNLSPRICGEIYGKSDLPSSFISSNVEPAQRRPYASLM